VESRRGGEGALCESFGKGSLLLPRLCGVVRVSTCSGLARVSESVWLRLGNLRELRRHVRIPGGSRDQTCTETDTQTTAWNQPHPGTGQGRQGPGPRTVSVTKYCVEGSFEYYLNFELSAMS